MIAPYTWPDKTLYDILARQEYLGHTITAKTHKVSYKSKKTRKNEEEQRYFFPNTHEPLVDEETFELAQKRIATRHRPTKAAEIDIFSGLLFCAGCRHKMYYQQGVNIEPRKFFPIILRRMAQQGKDRQRVSVPLIISAKTYFLI